MRPAMSINDMNLSIPVTMNAAGTFELNRESSPSIITQSLSRPANSSRRTGPWEPHEDERLLAIVAELGVKHWKLIGIRHGLRDGKQCRERWHNHLNPELKYSPLTPEEDLKIIEYHSKMGTKWAVMSQMLGRPANLIKNRFYSSLSKKRDFSQVDNADNENERSSFQISNSGVPRISNSVAASSMMDSPMSSRSNSFSSSLTTSSPEEPSNSDSGTFQCPKKKIKFCHEDGPNLDILKSKYDTTSKRKNQFKSIVRGNCTTNTPGNSVERWIHQEQLYRVHVNSWHELRTPAASPEPNETNRLNETSCLECYSHQQNYQQRHPHWQRYHGRDRRQCHQEDNNYLNNGHSYRRENCFTNECRYRNQNLHSDNHFDKHNNRQNQRTDDDSIPTPTYTPISSPRPTIYHYCSSALEQLADLAIMNSCGCRQNGILKARSNIMSISAVLN